MKAVVSDHRSAGLSEVDVAVMDFAEKVADDATSIQQSDIERLRSLGLADEEIGDVVFAAAARCFFSKLTLLTWTRRYPFPIQLMVRFVCALPRTLAGSFSMSTCRVPVVLPSQSTLAVIA